MDSKALWSLVDGSAGEGQPYDHLGILRLIWIGTVAVVLVASLLPSSSPPLRALDHLPISDKLQHIVGYALLSFLPTLHERPRVFLGISTAMILMGVGLEFGQLLSHGRSFELGDMIADAFGLVLGALLGLPLRRYLANTMKPKKTQFLVTVGANSSTKA